MAPAGGQKTCIYSILSIIFAFLFGLLGLIFGIIALVKISKDPNLKGKELAIAGIIISVVIGPIIFLMTIGAIAYFGVLNPSNFLPVRCETSSGFMCNEFNIRSADGMLIQDATIKNDFGGDIVVLPEESRCELSFEGKGGTFKAVPERIKNGDTTKISCAVPSKDYKISAKAKFNYTIAYYQESLGEQFRKQLTMEVYSDVK
jgi:hypothetical protein